MTKTIVALDFSSADKALEFLDQFDQEIYVKLGMEIIYSEGFDLVDQIKKRGHKIFLDLKLHDIPNTVYSAMKVLAQKGVDMVNVHAAGGIDMMKAAIRGLEEGVIEARNRGLESKERPLCIAVTQLTSTSQEMMNEELLIKTSVEEAVLAYAYNAKKAGLDGVVCSVHEAEKIHDHCGEDFLTVTPGIRLEDDSKDDQKRVASPRLAREMGADCIVVGRSITRADNPLANYERIEKIMEA